MNNWVRLTIPMMSWAAFIDYYKGGRKLVHPAAKIAMYTDMDDDCVVTKPDFLCYEPDGDKNHYLYRMRSTDDKFRLFEFLDGFTSGPMEKYEPIYISPCIIKDAWNAIRDSTLWLTPEPTVRYAYINYILHRRFVAMVETLIKIPMEKMQSDSYYLETAMVRWVTKQYPASLVIDVKFYREDAAIDLLASDVPQDVFSVKPVNAPNCYHQIEWTYSPDYQGSYGNHTKEIWLHTNHAFIWRLIRVDSIKLVYCLQDAIDLINQYRVFRKTLNPDDKFRDVKDKIRLWWNTKFNIISATYDIESPFIRTLLIYYIVFTRQDYPDDFFEELTWLLPDALHDMSDKDIEDVVYLNGLWKNGMYGV